MTTSWRYEFKKGKEAKIYVDSNQSKNYCMYRDILQNGHQLCGVEVYDLLTGPIQNPVREVVDDHTKRRLLSKPNVPEEAGICKYVEASEERFCGFCKMEASITHSRWKQEKEIKKSRELEYLMKNIHRIRGTSNVELHKRQEKSSEEKKAVFNETCTSTNRNAVIHCPPTCTNTKLKIYWPQTCTNGTPDLFCPRSSVTHKITSEICPARCI